MQISLQTDLVCEVNNHQCIFFFLFVLKFRTLFLWLQKKTFSIQCLILLTFFTFFTASALKMVKGLGKICMKSSTGNGTWILLLYIWHKVIHRENMRRCLISILHFIFLLAENYFVIWWFCNFVQNALLLTHYKTLNYFSPLSKLSLSLWYPSYQIIGQFVLCLNSKFNRLKKNRQLERCNRRYRGTLNNFTSFFPNC